MKLRTATLVVCVVDFVGWCVIAFASFMSRSDAATRGLDQAAGMFVTGLYLVTGALAVALVVSRRAPRTALALALAFPAALAAAFVAAVIAFT